MDTKKLGMRVMQYMPIGKWTATEVANRHAHRVVTRRKNEERVATKQDKLVVSELAVFKSKASEPATRAQKMRYGMLKLLPLPHPIKAPSDARWLKFSNIVWRAQRASRLSVVPELECPGEIKIWNLPEKKT